MIWQIHPTHPEKRIVSWILDALKDEYVLILPTDTVYGFVCSSESPRGIAKLYQLKNLPESKPLSLLCSDVAMASKFAHDISNSVFRFMKETTPGPFTFIFNANRNMDRRAMGKKKEVGIRIVDHPLIKVLLEEMGIPLISTSVPQTDDYYLQPEDIEEVFGKRVHAVVDSGTVENLGSTVLDCRDGTIQLIRRGAGAEILDRIRPGEFISTL